MLREMKSAASQTKDNGASSLHPIFVAEVIELLLTYKFGEGFTYLLPWVIPCLSADPSSGTFGFGACDPDYIQTFRAAVNSGLHLMWDASMRITKEALATNIVVRRLWTGTAPFGWHVCRDGAPAPIYASSDRYRSMHDAYLAAQARLDDFVTKRSMQPGVTEYREWQSCQVGADAGRDPGIRAEGDG